MTAPMTRRADPREAVVGVVLAGLLVGVAVLTLTLGELGIPLADLPGALAGGASGTERFVLEALRGPRMLVGLGAGAAFAVSGALFQTVTRNPLGSPDVIGLTAGAGAGAAAASLLWSGTVPIPVGAAAGALAAAAAVYLTTGHGFSSPGHLIIAGIGVSAMAVALIQYVVLVGQRDQSLALAGYLVGSLSARTWLNVAVVWTGLVVLLPVALALTRRVELLELGDDLAEALGASTRHTRWWAVVVAVALATVAVAVSGPIAFVALTAPQVAKRLARSPGMHLLLSALTGALLLCLADLLVQQAPVVTDLPVGVVTAGLGGGYLGWLLVREWKKGTL
ncbi:MAG TPA: iron chelate uptake ABC transporter family permease subunit [Segeticoccus sp.]|nr:iron chelate uptake ABC transporter family permease subunit [Segeticoccus sp.]